MAGIPYSSLDGFELLVGLKYVDIIGPINDISPLLELENLERVRICTSLPVPEEQINSLEMVVDSVSVISWDTEECNNY